MEVGTQQVVNEFLAVVLLRASCLVLEHDIVVPASLHAEILRIEQGIAAGNVDFSLLFLLGSPFLFLCCISRCESTSPLQERFTSFSFCASRSFLIFSSSRISSAASSSSSLSSSLLSSSSDPSESASMSRVSSRIRRRFASGSSAASPSCPLSPSGIPDSSWRFGIAVSVVVASSRGTPCFLAKCEASAWRSSARRSRAWLSASPPCPGCLDAC